MNRMAQWLSKATPAQKSRLARLAKTTVGTLRLIGGSYRTGGKPSVTADLAARIDRASDGEIPRESLCPACKNCEYLKRCKR